MKTTSLLMSKWHYSKFLVLLAFLLLNTRASTSLAYDRREVIKANHGAVATDDGRCSRIGRDVLREGGHAVDAAVAAAFCLGVVSPASSGTGGGAFMLISSENGTAQAFDMRETAPKKASKNMYAQNAALKSSGVLSIAVPGEIAGLYKAWKQYGKLPWRRLVRPAAHLARYGFKISPYLHMQMLKSKSDIMADKGLRNLFTSNGSLLQIGEACYNKQLAKTLRAISAYGTKPFYNGSIGVKLIKDIRKSGGILTMEDLQQYQVRIREPIAADVMGFKILGMPPPSAGGAAMVLILNILAQYGVPIEGPSSLLIHRQIEALKHAFALRMNLGDPDFVDIKKVVNDMLSTKFAKQLKKTIYDNMTFNSNHYGGKWNQINDHGTSHMSIVDSERNAVSMTSTVNAYFGAKYLSPSTGIVLNNEMDDFSVPAKRSENVPPPAPANFIHPGKRPLSSMTPAIILKGGQLRAVVGASGGAMIIAGTTEVFLNHFARGMDPFSSVMAPRYYHQLIPNVLQFENWTVVTGDHIELPAKTRAALQKKGHVLQSIAGGTICQFVVREFKSLKLGELVAVSDPRKGGFPAGF
ncbi:glutathione hydrolase 1-like isoform X2 [Lycium ferocissimum]|uniref:glutathione hydrolase 1-like isoform X2 n=2 Tax=Lycium ferocissimum TaxID=112874 RepID=UPI002815C69B|nr:glutathione hydrolase 1-like isoform X2 [Lycium ferocissimum]